MSFWSLHARPLIPVFLKIYLPPVAALGVLILLRIETGLPLSYFTRDPAEVTNQPFYLSLFSNINMVVWGAAANICLLSAVLLKRSGERGEFQKFLWYSGIITTWLYFDDMFMFHERVFPQVLHFPQFLLFAFYGGGILFYLFHFRRTILKTEFLLLLSSCGLFGMSMLADILESRGGLPAQHLFEDGPKLMAIVGWFAYFLRLSFAHLKDAQIFRSAAIDRNSSG